MGSMVKIVYRAGWGCTVRLVSNEVGDNMRTIQRRKRIALLLSAILLIGSSEALVQAKTADELKKTTNKIGELKEQKQQAQSKVDSLSSEENQLKGELADLNSQLSDVSAQINDLEKQIGEKEGQIEVTKKKLKKAKKKKNKQYESMKLRIQYIYENGDMNAAAVLLASESIGDLLNKAIYVEELNEYDRDMLTEYENVCKTVAANEKKLKNEKKELEGMQAEMVEKKDQVEVLIGQTQSSLSNKQQELADAKEKVNDVDSQIAKMKAYEEELEKRKIEEAKKEAARKKAQQQQQSKPTSDGNTTGAPVAATGGDQAMLAAIVECEAGGESYEGQLAVASVVLNRVRSGSYPNTISGVIYQGGQFAPVASGRFAVVLARGASASCAKAAAAALAGGTNVSALHFCRAESGIPGTVIGNHVFY